MAEYICKEELIDWLKDTLCDLPLVNERGWPFADGFEKAIDVVMDYPAADLKPVVHGKWAHGICSNCGISKYNFISFQFDDEDGYAKPFGTWDFCPRCGADMREKS